MERRDPIRSITEPRRVRRPELAWVVLITVLGLSLVLLDVVRSAPEPRSAAPSPSLLGAQIQQLETSAYEGDQLKARISAGEIKITQPRLLGPIRLGFLRYLQASDVTLHTHATSDHRATDGAESPPGSPQGLSLVVPRQLRAGLAGAEIECLKIIDHSGGSERVALEASRCRTTLTGKELVCRDGVFRSRAGPVRFRDASFDGNGWQVDE